VTPTLGTWDWRHRGITYIIGVSEAV